MITLNCWLSSYNNYFIISLGANKDVLDDVINQLSPKKPKSSQVKPSEQQDYSKTEDSPQNTSSVDSSICESNVKETGTNVSSKKGKKKKSSRMADQSGQEKISEVTSSPEKSKKSYISVTVQECHQGTCVFLHNHTHQSINCLRASVIALKKSETTVRLYCLIPGTASCSTCCT